METPGPDAVALPIRLANRPNDSLHADTAHAEDGTAQALLRAPSGKGLDTSPLALLPPELRTRIYEMALIQPTGIHLRASRELSLDDLFFDHTCSPEKRIESMRIRILRALRLMATCHQVRSEIKNRLLSLDDINVHGMDFHNAEKNYSRVQNTVPLLRRISSSLGLSSGRVVLWGVEKSYPIHRYNATQPVNLAHARRVPGLKHALSGYAQAIQPFQLYIGLGMNYFYAGTGHGHLCKQDAPVTTYDSRHFQCIIPLSDRMKAMKLVDEAIDERIALLRRQSEHQFCPVRVLRQKLESGLETARQYMREMVDRFFAA